MADRHDTRANAKIEIEEILRWSEFFAWTLAVMTPVIWWLQGPSVSTDQFVVRTTLFVISAMVAVGLRGRTMIHGRRDDKDEPSIAPAGRGAEDSK